MTTGTDVVRPFLHSWEKNLRDFLYASHSRLDPALSFGWTILLLQFSLYFFRPWVTFPEFEQNRVYRNVNNLVHNITLGLYLFWARASRCLLASESSSDSDWRLAALARESCCLLASASSSDSDRCLAALAGASCCLLASASSSDSDRHLAA